MADPAPPFENLADALAWLDAHIDFEQNMPRRQVAVKVMLAEVVTSQVKQMFHDPPLRVQLRRPRGQPLPGLVFVHEPSMAATRLAVSRHWLLRCGGRRLGLLRLHQLQEVLAALVGELGDQVGGVVGLHLIEHVGGAVVVELG